MYHISKWCHMSAERSSSRTSKCHSRVLSGSLSLGRLVKSTTSECRHSSATRSAYYFRNPCTVFRPFSKIYIRTQV